jgi:hypothetical protein
MAAPAIKTGNGFYFPETNGVSSLPAQRQNGERDAEWGFMSNHVAFLAPECEFDPEHWNAEDAIGW